MNVMPQLCQQVEFIMLSTLQPLLYMKMSKGY